MHNNKQIYDSWFEYWLTACVPNLMLQPKWFRSDVDLKPGDIVLFVKQESTLASNYQYGMVKSVEHSRDGKVRKAVIKYKNSNESCFRETVRSIRSLVIIHHVDELDINRELFLAKGY